MLRCTPLLLLATTAFAQNDVQSRIYRSRDRALPALVNVQPVLDVFRAGRKRQSTAIGSGVIVRKDGLVVTNFHVAGHAKRLFCTLADKTRVSAKLLGGDPATDLAVLQLDLKELKRLGATFKVAKLGSTSPPQVGEIVIALGSPRGLSLSLTRGVVSNTERFMGGNITLPTGELTGMYNNWLQTDAAINPGNSGGPLVNLEGEVIGINSRGIPGGDGLGFAIPADVVRMVYEQILKHGRVIRSWIGLDRGLEPIGFDAPVRGVRIGHVHRRSPAALAGVQPGDVILEIDGQRVDAMHLDEIPPIRRKIAESPVGKPLKLKLWRDKKTIELEVVTKELAASKAAQFAAKRFGITARMITETYARRNGLDDTMGVLVTSMASGGPGASSGLRRGDIIRKIGKAAIADLGDFKRLYNELISAKTKTVLLSIQRGNSRMLRALSPATKDEEEDE